MAHPPGRNPSIGETTTTTATESTGGYSLLSFARACCASGSLLLRRPAGRQLACLPSLLACLFCCTHRACFDFKAFAAAAAVPRRLLTLTLSIPSRRWWAHRLAFPSACFQPKLGWRSQPPCDSVSQDSILLNLCFGCTRRYLDVQFGREHRVVVRRLFIFVVRGFAFVIIESTFGLLNSATTTV